MHEHPHSSTIDVFGKYFQVRICGSRANSVEREEASRIGGRGEEGYIVLSAVGNRTAPRHAYASETRVPETLLRTLPSEPRHDGCRGGPDEVCGMRRRRIAAVPAPLTFRLGETAGDMDVRAINKK